jgi:hypothetical protein
MHIHSMCVYVCVFKQYSKQTKSDTWNCGVYCLKYLESLISLKFDDLKFPKTANDLSDYRDQIYTVLYNLKVK